MSNIFGNSIIIDAKWGEVLGELSDQTDLQSALNAKINLSDIATAAEIESETSGKVIEASSIVSDDITLVGNSKQKLPSEFSVKGYIDDKLPISYSIYNLSVDNTDNVQDGDHCPFDSTRSNMDISLLQTLGTTTYTTDLGVNSIGRVSLKSGYYYKITGFICSAGNSADKCSFSIWDVTTSGQQIGTFASNLSGMPISENNNSIISVAFLKTDVDSIIELRKTGGQLIRWSAGASGTSGYAECFMAVEVLGKVPTI